MIYFWISILALCIAPFLFNPHQFSLGDFIVDYREYLRWMSRGNSRAHANSWIGYCRLSRTKITGFKKKKMGHPSEKLSTDVPRATWRIIIISEILSPLFLAVILTVAYMFVKVRLVPSPSFAALTHSRPVRRLALDQRSPSNRRLLPRSHPLQRRPPHHPFPHLALRWANARRLLR